jgi:hypothetical protein
MTAYSQVFQNKRGRDDYWKGWFALPEAKRTNSELRLVHDSDLMALLDKIDNMDNNEETSAVNEIEGEIRLNGVIKSLEDEIGLKAATDYKIEFTDEKGSADQMSSVKKGEATAGGSNSEATTVCDIGAHLPYYDDVSTDLDFFVDYIFPDDLGIIVNYTHGDSMANIMYSDAMHGNSETTEVFYGSLWEDDICLLNEHPII